MSDYIKLFQNDRNWKQIRSEVLELIEQDHSVGMSQQGNLVNKLESVLCERFNRRYCVTTASCTDALIISILTLNLPKRSQIAVSNYTFTASAHAISRAGYNVIPVDVNNNYCIDTLKIPYCDAVMAVDIFGNMSDWRSLESLNVPVICDAAQSFESKDNDGWSAEKGLISCVSFSPSKTISSWGSGGALLTNDADIANMARRLRLHGKINNNDDSIHPGMNSMISTFEAACILIGLKYSESWHKRRKEIFNYLILNSIYKSGIDKNIKQHTLHKLVFQSDNRDDIQKKFFKEKIDFIIHYNKLINDETLYNKNLDLSISNRLKSISFTVPNQHTLTDKEVERIVKVLK
jgi:dTDP-4-amino-4,6-dideoxygalactose transaminase